MPIECPNPFGAPGQWYRGNLHMHTTRSDGHKDPADAVAWYRDKGYDFTAITDHRRIPEPEDLRSDDQFLVIPGEELDLFDRKTGVPYHIVCLGVKERIDLPKEVTVQEALSIAAEKAQLSYVAHPYWHGHEVDDLAHLQGHTGIEIYNETCEMLIGKGSSVAYWDALLKRGILTWGFAADDTHWNRPDCGAAWVQVKAEELSAKSLLDALRKGNFYSSTGPEIIRVELDQDRLHVHTSPAAYIAMVGPGPRGGSVVADKGDTVTEATFRVTGNEAYLRVQVVDSQGRTAWTNPIVFSINGNP